MGRESIVRVGLFALAFALGVPLVGPDASPRALPISDSGGHEPVGVQGAARAPHRVRDHSQSFAVAGFASTPIPTPAVTVETRPAPTPEPVAVPATPVAVPATPAPTRAPAPTIAPPPVGGTVIASWYGPGFYGNRTACGQLYTPEIIGVAHRTLPCGTLLVLEYRGKTVSVPVIDRGPFIAGRTLDLSNATRLSLACPDLCTLSMRIAQ